MISSALNIGSTGLKSAQIGLDVTSHNIANVHTPGYKRQEVQLSELTQYRETAKQFNGMGVEVSGIKKATNPWLENQLPNSISDAENANKTNEVLNGLNDILKNNNLSDSMKNMLNSFQEVANNPSSVSIRDLALKNSEKVIDTYNNLNNSINDFKNNLNKEKSFSLKDINNKIEILALSQKNNDTNTINSTIEDLSKYMKVDSNSDKNIISVNGKVISQNGNPSLLANSDLDNIQTGSIGAINKIQNSEISNVLNKTNTLMNDFTNKVNDVYKSGFDLDGGTNKNLFNNLNGQYTLTTNDPRKVQGSSVSTPGINDGTVAQNISELRNYKDNNQTFFEKNKDIINDVEFSLDKNKGMTDYLNNGLENLKNQISSYSGVNLDEEGVNLLKFQRMYEANAKVIQIADSMIGTLLNIKT